MSGNTLIILSLCGTQAESTEDEKVEKLLDILLRRDDSLLPKFCEALLADQQPHVVEILKRNGL